MTEALGAALRPVVVDDLPSLAAAPLAAELLETCAAAAALGSAFELGVVARVAEDAADPATVAADCGLTQQGAEALLAALAALDILANESRDGPRAAVLYALGLVLRTTRGRIYPHSTFRRWLDEGGFEDIRRNDLADPFPLSLITARRR
jgi:hypothetical protein